MDNTNAQHRLITKVYNTTSLDERTTNTGLQNAFQKYKLNWVKEIRFIHGSPRLPSHKIHQNEDNLEARARLATRHHTQNSAMERGVRKSGRVSMGIRLTASVPPTAADRCRVHARSLRTALMLSTPDSRTS